MASVATKQAILERANAAYQAGDFPGAAELYRQLLKLEPKNPGVHLNLGKSLALSGDSEGAKRHLRETLKVRPEDPAALAQLASCYRQEDRVEDALRAADRALRADPTHAFALWTKADILRIKGEFREACELLRPHAEREGADPTLVMVFAMLARRFDGVDRSIERLRAVLDRPGLAQTGRAQALFQLGDMLDKAGRYDEAWAAFEEANELRRRPWDVDAFERDVDRIIAAWSPETLGELPRSTLDTELPVFVVGMLRSGTTLTEQIVSSHPAVVAGGELRHMREAVEATLGPDADLEGACARGRVTEGSLTRAGRTYLRKLQKLGPKALRVTDKMPYNFQFLGLISLMFPRARVIHCQRDPLDTCLSCYFHDFTGSHDYSCDLERLGRYARQYRRLMEHWGRVLDLPIYTLRYEELVADQERVSRELIQFLGLEWDEACLRFHESGRAAVTWSSEQVREPIFTRSAGRHANYEKHIGPLREALGRLTP
ncbi:MAG: sulfotransferase [Phycisphaerales bacterium]